MNSWDKKFMNLAEHIASWSKDQSRQVGAIIVDENSKDVISLGYNGIPRGCNDDKLERQERPLKYKWFEHAERNAIYNAARHGKTLFGKSLYVTMFPCADCARAIIQSGIKTVYSYEPNMDNERWCEHFKISIEMFEEAGIFVKYVK